MRTRLRAFSRQRAGLSLGCAALLTVLAGCDDRDPFYDRGTSLAASDDVGLVDGVAIHDSAAQRFLMVTAHGDQQPSIKAIPIGQNLAKAEPSTDRTALYVLARGALDRRRASGMNTPMGVNWRSKQVPSSKSAGLNSLSLR